MELNNGASQDLATLSAQLTTIASYIDTEVAAIGTATGATPLTGNAVVANVLNTKTFYKDDHTTKLTGVMPNNAGAVACVSASITAGTTLSVVPATGYTDGVDDTSTIDLTTVDADLAAGKIKAGTTILGVVGTFTDDADAVAGDIASGKTAWVNGVKIVGTHE